MTSQASGGTYCPTRGADSTMPTTTTASIPATPGASDRFVTLLLLGSAPALTPRPAPTRLAGGVLNLSATTGLYDTGVFNARPPGRSRPDQETSRRGTGDGGTGDGDRNDADDAAGPDGHLLVSPKTGMDSPVHAPYHGVQLPQTGRRRGRNATSTCAQIRGTTMPSEKWDETGKTWDDDHGLLDVEQIEKCARADTAEPLRSPIPTRMISNGEYMPVPQTAQQQRVEARVEELTASSTTSASTRGWRPVHRIRSWGILATCPRRRGTGRP